MPLALRWKPSALPLASLPLIRFPDEELFRKIPWSLLLSSVLPETVEAVVPDSLTPPAVRPLAGWPAPVTVLPEMVMLLELETDMPYPLVSVIRKPWIVT